MAWWSGMVLVINACHCSYQTPLPYGQDWRNFLQRRKYMLCKQQRPKQRKGAQNSFSVKSAWRKRYGKWDVSNNSICSFSIDLQFMEARMECKSSQALFSTYYICSIFYLNDFNSNPHVVYPLPTQVPTENACFACCCISSLNSRNKRTDKTLLWNTNEGCYWKCYESYQNLWAEKTIKVNHW